MDVASAAGDVTLYVGALAAAGLAGRWAWRASRSIHRLADVVAGDERRGVPGLGDRLDRIDKRLDSMDQRLQTVELQVSPNSGKSMFDAVTRIKEATVRDD